MTKSENIEFWGVSRPHEYGCNIFQAILDKRLSFSSMFQGSYRFNIHILMFANELRPHKSHAHHRHKSCDALHVAHMGVLDVEAGGFHGFEGRLDLPAFLIDHDCILGAVEAYEDLQFGDSVGVFDPAPGKIDIFTIMKEELIVKFSWPILRSLKSHHARIRLLVKSFTIQKFCRIRM